MWTPKSNSKWIELKMILILIFGNFYRFCSPNKYKLNILANLWNYLFLPAAPWIMQIEKRCRKTQCSSHGIWWWTKCSLQFYSRGEQLITPCMKILMWVFDGLLIRWLMNSMKLVIPLHFTSWKNSFSDNSRKRISPNMIRAVTAPYLVKFRKWVFSWNKM